MIIFTAHLGHISLKTINFSQREDNIRALIVKSPSMGKPLLYTRMPVNAKRIVKYPHFATPNVKIDIPAKSLQSCPTPWDSVDCSLPDSSIHGILQARTLEWVFMPSSRGSS